MVCPGTTIGLCSFAVRREVLNRKMTKKFNILIDISKMAN
jgi:hypothetical protein